MNVSEIVVENRIRQDMGDIDALATSIQEYGLIEPLVLGRDNKLIAGERRLRALKKVGVKELEHGVHFVYNDEIDPLRRTAMEIEENVKRQELTWQEQVQGKKRLLEIMQSIHGVARSGKPSANPEDAGFGINKLAAMLGESNAQTSRDIELANLITIAPQLARADTKEAARRQATLAVVVAAGLAKQQASPVVDEQKWKLYEGKFEDNVSNIPSNSVDLLIVDPPYGEDVQGMAANSRDLLARPFADSQADVLDLISKMASHGYRILNEHRFAVFFFGFAVYPHLVGALRLEGFEVDLSPLVWVKNTVINTSPYTKYGRSYEPILIARKGSPKLLRPAQRDVIEMQNVITRGTNEQKLYQAQKPVALIEKFVIDMTIPGATIVDFCAGSGTAGVAALQQKRRVVLFEKDPTACQIIRSRLSGL